MSPRAQEDTSRAATRPLEVSVLRSHDQLCSLRPEWDALYERSAAKNPFASPTWQIAWSRHFIGPSELYVHTARRDGELIAVAPLYRRDYSVGRVRVLKRVRLFGAGKHSTVTELPQVLILPGQERRVLRAVIGRLAEADAEWDWCELWMPPEHGWFEPEWLRTGSEGSPFVIHVGSVACVVMPLAASWTALMAGLKRNVRESLRRSANRLNKSDSPWSAEIVPMSETQEALEELLALHHARAIMPGKPPHPDYFAPASHGAFIRDVVQQMAERGELKFARLRVAGTTIAAMLILRAHKGVFFSFSGLDPTWWRFGAMTLLQAECLRDALESGDQVVNFSIGPTVAKLRWSEQIEVHNQFTIVRDAAIPKLSFGAFAALRAGVLVARRGRQGAGRAWTGRRSLTVRHELREDLCAARAEGRERVPRFESPPRSTAEA
jgi:CelD/BcsL family acetyltransferase involved in cellulose biosynthesis